MRTDLISEMYQLEETYWWHVAKRRLVTSLLQQELPSQGKLSPLVDVGCGTGAMLQDLSHIGPAIGLDGSLLALEYCRRRGIESIVAANLEKSWPLMDQTASAVTMLDVLEHLENDGLALREVYRVLQPGGLFVLTVPAYPRLWTYWDEALGHKRRYRRSQLTQKLVGTGFSVLRSSYFYCYLLPIAVAFRLIKSLLGSRVKTRSDFVSLPQPFNRLLLSFSRIETACIRRTSLPTGLSIVCICRKD